MGAIFGVLFHFIGGFASGSFYIPYKKVSGWSWESYWITGGIFSWLIVPPIAAYLTIPDFASIISSTSGTVLFWTYLMGLLWGIGGLTYGLGVRYLGVSLGSSIILGLCSVFGSIIPSIYYNFNPTPNEDTIHDLMTTSWGQMVLLGLAICVAGIVICGKAGGMKDKDLNGKTADNAEFDISKGLVFAIISGVLSACFSFGIEADSSMAMTANTLGNGASSWILHMAFIILVANSWGLVLNEWKGVSKKTLTTIVAGILTIILSVLVVGYGNSLKG